MEEIKNFIEKVLINNLFKETSAIANLSFHDFVEQHDDYVVAEFYGGLNGNGNWSKYMDVISDIFWNLDVNGFDYWLIDLQNDCLDDVFTLKIGIRIK